MSKNYLSPIKEIVKDAKKGKMFILVDDKDRENEGDLVIIVAYCMIENNQIGGFKPTVIHVDKDNKMVT